MKRIISLLLAIIMLVCLIPADLAYARGEGEEERKLDVVLLSDGQYMIKLPGVDYTRARQAAPKPDINPTDNPKEFSSRTVKVDCAEVFLQATGIKKLTVIVTCGDANYSKEYKDLSIEQAKTGIKVPVPKAKYFPQINVKFDDGRDARYAVEAHTEPSGVVNILISFMAHTGVATRWHGTSEKPDVEGNYLGINNTPHKFNLPKVNQNSILKEGNDPWSWQGHDNTVNLSKVPWSHILCNDETTAKTCHLLIQDKVQGKLADSKYYFQIIGDGLHGFHATMREETKVIFDANGAKYNDDTTKKENIFANGLKVGDENFSEFHTFESDETRDEVFKGTIESVGIDGLKKLVVPTTNDIKKDSIPKKTENGKELEQEFQGWSRSANGSVIANINDEVIEGDVTFYAIYAPVAQGKVKVEYKDSKTNAAIESKYQLKGQEYPAEKTGDMDKAIKDEVFDTNKAPKFLGYKIKSITTDPVPNPPATANYTKNGDYTVIYTYDELDDIIPEKKNGQDNPDVTPEVKENYAKVTFQVAAADGAKAKLQLDGADATSPLVYYVNPLKGKTIAEVASVKAVSKDDNLYKVDANDMWTYNPDSITGTDQVISQATDTQGNVVKTEITLTAKVADKTAAKFKDKLKPVDIKVWEDKDDKDGSKIDWKKGVELKEANDDLKKILDKTETKVTDESKRNSSKANLPNGQKGNLKVTFEDGSSLEVKDQTLYVAPHKNDDNTNLPKDAVKVEFKIGDGVTGTEKTEYVKPGTDVKNDAPAVTLKTGYKDAKWYKGDAVAADADYKVTSNAVFTAKATGKDKVVKLDDPDNPTNFPKDPTDNSKKDADYVTVKFVADANGKIKEGDAEKTKGIAYAVLKNTEWKDAVDAGVVVPDENATGNNPKLVGKDKFYSFKEWQKDGTKVTTFPKVEATDLTFTAVFGKADEYSVTYNLNAPEGLTVGGTAPTDDTKYLKDEEVTVKAPAADNTIAGYKFNGWNTKADGKGTTYAADAKFAIKANTELFAQWEKTAKDVIPVDNENDKKGKDGEEIPTNYVFVEFKVKDTDADKAEIKAGQQAKFKVDPKVAVTLTAPALELKDGYKDSHIASFNKDDYTNKKFEQATTIWAVVIEKLVVPTDPSDPKTGKDQVLVKFLKGEHGTLTGIVLDEHGNEVIAKNRDVLAYNVKNTATWAAMKDYIPSAIADSGWRVANPSWKPILPEAKEPVKEATYTAQYVAKPTDRYITLTLDENYRNGKITDYEVVEGDLIEDYLYIPRRRGYVFEGWSYNSRRLEEVRPGDRVYYPTTLYAIWAKQKAKDDEEVEPIDTRAVNEHKAYMFGYTDGSVRPNGSITRAEAAALVTRLLGIEANASSMKPAFTDTPSSWYNKAINAAVARGIMKGYPDGRFRPNAPITRAEFTQMIYTFDNKPYGVAPFADVVGHWAERAIGSEYQAKRITGYPDGLFRPDANITRAEAVVILNKIFERNYDAMSPINAMNKEKIKVFTDLHTSFWGYNDMVEATNTHLFKRRVPGRVEEDWTLVK